MSIVVIYYTVQLLSSDLCNVLAWPVHHVLQDPCYGTKKEDRLVMKILKEVLEKQVIFTVTDKLELDNNLETYPFHVRLNLL